MKNSILPILALMALCTPNFKAQTVRSTLFLGNSYTAYNNLPGLVQDMAQSTGDSLLFDSYNPGGFRLFDHTNSFVSQGKISSKNWDYVAIQGQSQEPILQRNTFNSAFRTLLGQIHTANPCAVVMPFMTWGRKNGDSVNCPNFPDMCTYQSMDKALRREYLKVTQYANGVVSPVSSVWYYLRQNHPGIDLYQQDGSHPSRAGTYAAACTFYTSIFRKDPSAITIDFNLPAAEAGAIRSAAKKVVYDSLAKWDFQQAPSASIRLSKGSAALDIRFLALNIAGSQQSYLWDFGDGTTSTLSAPLHSFPADGTYNIELKAYKCDSHGWDTLTVDTLVQLCGHTPTVFSRDSILCENDTLWTEKADSYQWLAGNVALPGQTRQYLPNYHNFAFGGLAVLSTVNGCSELSEPLNKGPVSSGYFFDALGDPCAGDTVAFAVLHFSGGLNGNEIIQWFRNDSLLPSHSNEDTLLITRGGKYELKVVDTTGPCPFDTTISLIEYSCGLGIEEANVPLIHSLYPNPATDELIVLCENDMLGHQLFLYNMQGELLWTTAVEMRRTSILLEGIPSGIYFLNSDHHRSKPLKFIKK